MILSSTGCKVPWARGRCASPEPLYRRCLQIDSTAQTTCFHFASIVSVISQPPQEIPAAFQGLGFPKLLPIVPNRRCLRAYITTLSSCQVYICEVSGRCSRSTAPAQLATNALLRPVTNCNIFGIGNKRSRERGCSIGSFPLHARKEGGFPCSTKNRSIAP